jgi:hypothetical protein
VLRSLRSVKTGPVEPVSRPAKPAWWEVLGIRRLAQGPSAPGQTQNADTSPDLLAAMRRIAAMLVLRADLTRSIGKKQAEYLARMMEMFDKGDLDAALRHAIPLSDKPGSGDSIPALGVPDPRQNLDIQAGETTAGSSLGFGPTLFADLKTIYRRAFEKLEREGRIEEAAFVLADLLHVNEEAVAFLEKQGRLQLAAEIAEARDLPAGLVVRQWFLAGDTDRAVRIARSRGAFPDAVVRLERSKNEKAKTLRTLWAQSLAQAGDYSKAVDVVWPVEEARTVARRWAELAMESGGVGGARMMARLLSLPEMAPESNAAISLRQRARILLEGEDPESAPEREAFTETLIAGPSSPITTALGRLAVRGVWRDLASGARRIAPQDSRKLIQFVDDAGLRTDLPPLPKPPPLDSLSTRSPLQEIRLADSDAGTMPLYDAAFLPNGNSLVAMGEAGARLLARDGHTIAHFEAPTHRLVMADSGNHALLLAPRGDVWTISRLDLVSRRVSHWTNAALTAFAPDYDGSLWFIGIRDTFVVIDATSDTFEALWRMPEVPGVIRAIGRSVRDVSFLVQDKRTRDTWGMPSEASESWERWLYELPSLVLRHRNDAAISPEDPFAPALPTPVVCAAGHCAEFARTQNSAGESVLEYRIFNPTTSDREGPRRLAAYGEPLLVTRSANWSFFATRTPVGITGELLPFRSDDPVVLQLDLQSAARLSARLSEATLTLSDDRGRLLVISLSDGTLLRNLRVG